MYLIMQKQIKIGYNPGLFKPKLPIQYSMAIIYHFNSSPSSSGRHLLVQYPHSNKGFFVV